MSNDLKDILSQLNPDIDQETLLRYLEGKLSHEQQHEVEKKMLDDEFTSDALEGLKEIRNKQGISELIKELNRDLKKKTDKKKRFREKMQLKMDPWILITVFIILTLVIISYIIIKRQMGH
jgi:hypothetical protein